MAAKITHLEVMKQSLYLLEHGSSKEQSINDRIKNAFMRYAATGAVAPDIFYFYHVLSRAKNPLGMHWGNLSHHSRVFDVMVALLDGVKEMPEGERRNKCYAFAMGYISHCAVDIITHPYIFYVTGDYYSIDLKQAARAQENHLRVEYMLDAYLVHQRWGMNPSTYNFIQYVDIRESGPSGKAMDYHIWSLWVNALAKAHPDEFENSYYGSSDKIYPGDILNDSYMGFMRFNRILDTRSRFVRGFLTTIDFATFHRVKARYLLLPPGETVSPRITNEAHKEWKYPADPLRKSSESFMELVHSAARFSAKAMSDADAYISGSKKRKDLEKEYDGYNLDTGLRSESIHMQEFEVIEED